MLKFKVKYWLRAPVWLSIDVLVDVIITDDTC